MLFKFTLFPFTLNNNRVSRFSIVLLKTGCGRIRDVSSVSSSLGKTGRVTFVLPEPSGWAPMCAYTRGARVRTSYSRVRPHPGSVRRLMNDQAGSRGAQAVIMSYRSEKPHHFFLSSSFFIRSTFLSRSCVAALPQDAEWGILFFPYTRIISERDRLILPSQTISIVSRAISFCTRNQEYFDFLLYFMHLSNRKMSH